MLWLLFLPWISQIDSFGTGYFVEEIGTFHRDSKVSPGRRVVKKYGSINISFYGYKGDWSGLENEVVVYEKKKETDKYIFWKFKKKNVVYLKSKGN